jgi:hypothetical protein
MDHRATSISFLRSTGLIPVKVRPGQKDPFPEWDPRRAVHENHEATLNLIATPANGLNLGALFHGKWVDIDIDTKNPSLLAGLDYFLPRTRYVWGRASKPRSHRAYQLHTDFDRAPVGSLLRFIKKLELNGEQMSVEIRGGTPENGLFAVLPGSVHPSGEDVVWATEIDPTVSDASISLMALLKAVRMAQAAALVASFWVEGMRNDLSLALSGLMWRIRASSLAVMGLDDEDEVPDEVFILKQDDAQALLNAVMKIGGDDEADQRSRTLNFVNTWKKLDIDPTSKVTGGKVMAEIIGGGSLGDKVVKSLYRLLSDNEGVEQLEMLCEQFCMWYGQGVLIDTKMVDVGLPVPWMSREQASNSLAGRKVKIGDKKVNIVAILFGTSIIQRVAGLTFDPSSDDRMVQTPQGTMINQWRGFECEPSPQSVTADEIKPFLDYVMGVLANGNQQAYDWILDWCADLLQDPAKKPGTALVLVGAQGAGKTFLGEHVLGRIIGTSHYVQMNSIESLTNKFNQIADNKIFVQCDEAVHSYQKDVAARLKSIITDETMTVEPKNVNAFKKPNHMHFLFTSNEEQTAIFIDPTPHERRFTVQKVSNVRAGDLEYWTFMHGWTPGALPKIMRWLQDRKYQKRSVLRPLDTAAKRDIQRVGVDPEVSWIIARIATGFPLSQEVHQHWWQAFSTADIKPEDEKRDTLRRDVWPNLVYASAIEDDFRAYIRKHGRPVYSGNVLTNIKRALPTDSIMVSGQRTVEYNDPRHGQLTKERVRLYTFPTVEAILDHLRARFGSMVDDLIAEEKSEIETQPAIRHVEEF